MERKYVVESIVNGVSYGLFVGAALASVAISAAVTLPFYLTLKGTRTKVYRDKKSLENSV